MIFYIAQEKYLPQLVTQTKLKRTKTPNKNGQRSKYIIRPEYAVMVGNHVVWTLVKGEFLALAATKKKNRNASPQSVCITRQNKYFAD